MDDTGGAGVVVVAVIVDAGGAGVVFDGDGVVIDSSGGVIVDC